MTRMCHECTKRDFPQRDNICLEEGAFFANFEGCAQCKEKDVLHSTNRVCEETDGVEIITYQHVCQNCNHTIAEHEYRFTVEDGYQMYEMECLLCGTSEDTRSILPSDPRHEAAIF